MGWLPLKNMLEYEDAQMIYKIIDGSALSYLSNLFKGRFDKHDRCTRNCSYVNISKCRTFKYNEYLGTEVQKSEIVFKMR